ncbi:hypothetical protein Tco_0026067 [Tanacetum coccineum]
MSRISQRSIFKRSRSDLHMGDRMTLQETVWMVEEEAYASREAWDHSIGLSQATHQELQTHRDHVSHGDNRRNVQTARPCFYADFMKCQPLNFKGAEGVVGFNCGFKKMESVFNISGCAIENQSKVCHLHSVRCCFDLVEWSDKDLRSRGICNDLGCTKKKMTDKYCSQGEIKKLEIELWNLRVKGNDVPTYTERFPKLT